PAGPVRGGRRRCRRARAPDAAAPVDPQLSRRGRRPTTRRAGRQAAVGDHAVDKGLGPCVVNEWVLGQRSLTVALGRRYPDWPPRRQDTKTSPRIVGGGVCTRAARRRIARRGICRRAAKPPSLAKKSRPGRFARATG